jgi:uncharacterized protein involved in response to NO
VRLPARVAGHSVFFPAAAAYAALALPASVLAMTGHAPALPGLASPATHAHEMLFGFTLAVIAGNQLGPTPRARLVLMAACWAAARAAFLAWPQAFASALPDAAFALLLAREVVPRLFTRAKKLRNRAQPLVIAAICACSLALSAAFTLDAFAVQHGVAFATVLLLALLMLFMGGRIIAPAAAGARYRQGEDMAQRVQPRIEGALIVAMLAAIGAWTASIAMPNAIFACGSLLAVAAALAAVRAWRWKLWLIRGRPDLACLGLGYAWLVVGLASLALALVAGRHALDAVHAVTVGALGTLTINVMALTQARLARRDPARERLPLVATALVNAAAVARIAAGFHSMGATTWLSIAAFGWSAAYLALLAFLLSTRRPEGPPCEP